MPLRPCLDCGTPTDRPRCPLHTRAAQHDRDKARGSSTQRGYGSQHQRERAEWQTIINANDGVPCRRAASGQCLRADPIIHPDQAWDLGHPDATCPTPKAPEHRGCNRSTAGRGTRT